MPLPWGDEEDPSSPAYAVYLSVSPTKGTAPLSVLVSGGVTIDGKPYVADVYIYRNGVLIRTLRSSGLYGTFEMYDVLTAAGTYNYQAKAMGVSSPVRTVTVTAPPPAKTATSLALVGSPLQGPPPLTVTLWATLSDVAGGGVGGRKVSVYRNGTFMFSKLTDEGGRITGYAELTAAGTYKFIADFTGDDLYLPSSSNVVTVTVTAPPPPPPEEWTHKLMVYFYRLPWADPAVVEGAITATLIPVVNAVEWLVGFDFLGYSLDWEGMALTLYYKQRASPAITAGMVAALLIAVAAVLVGVGVVIMALAWYEREKRIARESTTLDEMLEKGLITAEQYTELKKSMEETPPPWTEVIPTVMGALVFIAVLYLASKLLEKRKEGV